MNHNWELWATKEQLISNSIFFVWEHQNVFSIIFLLDAWENFAKHFGQHPLLSYLSKMASSGSVPAARQSCWEPRHVGHVPLSEPYEVLPLAIALTAIFAYDELDSQTTVELWNRRDIKTYLLSPYDLIVQGCWQDAFLAQLAGAIWEVLLGSGRKYFEAVVK